MARFRQFPYRCSGMPGLLTQPETDHFLEEPTIKFTSQSRFYHNFMQPALITSRTHIPNNKHIFRWWSVTVEKKRKKKKAIDQVTHQRKATGNISPKTFSAHKTCTQDKNQNATLRCAFDKATNTPQWLCLHRCAQRSSTQVAVFPFEICRTIKIN